MGDGERGGDKSGEISRGKPVEFCWPIMDFDLYQSNV